MIYYKITSTRDEKVYKVYNKAKIKWGGVLELRLDGVLTLHVSPPFICEMVSETEYANFVLAEEEANSLRKQAREHLKTLLNPPVARDKVN